MSIPDGAYLALTKYRDSFHKCEQPIVERLLTDTNPAYLSALSELNSLFSSSALPSWCIDGPMVGQWLIFFHELVFCVEHFNKESATKIKAEEKAFAEKLAEIQETATKLAEMLEVQEINGNKYGFMTRIDPHPLGLLTHTAENTCSPDTASIYNSFIKHRVAEARTFDLKYFPSIAELIYELARQADNGYEVHTDSRTPKQIHKNNELLDRFFRGVYDEIELKRLVPEIRNLTDPCWCAILNSATGTYEFSKNNLEASRNRNK